MDTSAFVAVQDGSDEKHEQAVKFWRQLSRLSVAVYTSNFVFDETYTVLLRRVSRAAAIDFGAAVKTSNAIQMIFVDESIHALAWQIAAKYKDKSFSFTDCTSFAIMSELKVSHAFCFDVHFEQYGGIEVVPSGDTLLNTSPQPGIK